MVDIIISPKDAWDRLAAMGNGVNMLVATNNENGAKLFLTSMVEEDYPVAIVTVDGDLVYEQIVVNSEDCEETVSEVIDTIMYDLVTEVDGCDNDGTEDLVAEREAELADAIYDFLNVAVLDTSRVDAAVFEDCLEHFLEYIHLKHKLPVYRPMVIEYNDGSESFEEYPYDCLEFDDENSVVYK